MLEIICVDKNEGNPFLSTCVDTHTDRQTEKYRQTDRQKLAHGCIENKPLGTTFRLPPRGKYAKVGICFSLLLHYTFYNEVENKSFTF